jgi:GntR family transcriptional repressor for pyruvate dehydrogenase complex
MRDAAGARNLMDDHVKMIRARRVAEHGEQHGEKSRSRYGCC